MHRTGANTNVKDTLAKSYPVKEEISEQTNVFMNREPVEACVSNCKPFVDLE